MAIFFILKMSSKIDGRSLKRGILDLIVFTQAPVKVSNGQAKTKVFLCFFYKKMMYK